MEFFDDTGEFFNNVGNIFEDEINTKNINSFKEGVESTSNIQVIYIDPNALKGTYFESPEDTLVKQLDDQVPGASDALLKRYNDSSAKPISFKDIAIDHENIGPSAIHNVVVNGSEYCVVTYRIERLIPRLNF